MSKIIKTLLATFTLAILANFSYADDNYYDQAIKKFDKKDYDEAKFLLERNIVLNPKTLYKSANHLVLDFWALRPFFFGALYC